jgi:hypothetical protein
MRLDNDSYLAGLIDGEGSVGLFSAGAGRKRFVIEIKMTNEPVIDWLIDHYGGNKQARKPGKVGWKPQWRWRVQGDAALKLYERVRPLLKIKGNA